MVLLTLFILFLVSFVRASAMNKNEIADLIQKEVAKQLHQISLQSLEQNKRISELEEIVRHLKENCNCKDHSMTERDNDSITAVFKEEYNENNANNLHSDISAINEEVVIKNSAERISAGNKRLMSNSKLFSLYFTQCLLLFVLI